MSCPFCEDQAPGLLLVYSRRVPDEFRPASPGHTLIIPRRHVDNWWGMTPEEQSQTCWELEWQRDLLRNQDSTITGWNIGMNLGQDAGQTVFHAHTHLIPRRHGDVPDPRYGIARSLVLGT